jgi:DNA-binding MarR family transcriptional regulator
MDNREQYAGFLVRELSNEMKKAGHHRDEQNSGGLTMMQGWVIGYLANNKDHDIFQIELETQLNIGKSTLTEVLHLMEKNNLVKRVMSETDGRCKKIVMTDKARQIDMQISREIEKREQLMRQGISDEEYEVFIRTIKKMIANLSSLKEA